MENNKAEIYYLFHSGFAVKLKNRLLIFDYYMDENKNGKKGLDGGTISEEDIKSADSVFVFVSHSHFDHFNPIVFDWQKANDNIHYFLSYEVKTPATSPRYHNLYPHEEYDNGDIKVKAYGSTDLGVSFLVDIDGLRIFHAGDLNCWFWYNGSTVQQLGAAKDMFLNELDQIEGVDIDIAFFPVDPRLEDYFFLGGEYFIKRFYPKLFVPMHFGRRTDITDSFAEMFKELPIRIARLSHRGQKITY
ncbi:MAG: MBL fold metallo-hydrolase [Clostridiales bacterium]|nr:MBL fold metallo-hydrolase [Clostridiales bacterium]